jgi:ABC-type multidrug transport system ATPase subunit
METIMASYQYVYHMDGVSKTYPGGKKCFENINLNFLPGVKIGVVGVNGSGKSTLLRIMAGHGHRFQRRGLGRQGRRVGYLPQEPWLDPTLDVKGNVMLGVAKQQAILDRYNELAMNYSDETADEMSALQDQIDAQNLWELDATVGVAMDALRCPPDDADVETLSGGERRRVALTKLLLEAPDMLLLDEPTNHLDAESIAWLQKHLIAYKGTILIVTHDRYFLDDITSWILELDRGRGIPYEGNYSAWLEQKAKRMQQEAREDKSKQKVLEKELEWIRAGAKARQAKSKARISRYNEMAGQTVRERASVSQIIIPNGERLGLQGHRGDGPEEAHGRQAVDREPQLHRAAGGHRGGDRPERGGQIHAVPHDHRAGTARRGHHHAGRHGAAFLRGPVARRAGPQQDRVGGNLGRVRDHPPGRHGDEQPRLCRGLQLQGHRPAEEGREQEVQDVAVLDLIGLAFHAELARLFCAGFAVAGDVIVIGDGFGADEALFEIAVDHACRLRGERALGIVQARASFGPTVK